MYIMKVLRVSEARAQFGAMLDEAEGGEAVVIERHGMRFVLRAERPAPPARKGAPLLDYVHRDVERGNWTWAGGARGLQFRSRRGRSIPGRASG